LHERTKILEQVRPPLDTAVYPHKPTYVHTPRNFTNGASVAWRLQ